MNAKEVNFAYKIRNALNAHVETLPTATTDRLASARLKALAVKRPEQMTGLALPFGKLSGNWGSFMQPSSWLNRAGLIIPLIALIFGLSGMYNFEQQKRLNETADIDAAVLSDELPLSAYLDHGFSAYLAGRAE